MNLPTHSLLEAIWWTWFGGHLQSFSPGITGSTRHLLLPRQLCFPVHGLASKKCKIHISFLMRLEMENVILINERDVLSLCHKSETKEISPCRIKPQTLGLPALTQGSTEHQRPDDEQQYIALLCLLDWLPLHSRPFPTRFPWQTHSPCSHLALEEQSLSSVHGMFDAET